MLKFDTSTNNKYLTNNLLRPKNLQFSSRTNLNTNPLAIS